LVVIQFLFKISSAALWSLWATTDLWAGGGQRIHRCPWPVHRRASAQVGTGLPVVHKSTGLFL